MTSAFALPFQAPPERQLTEAETAAAFDADMAESEARSRDVRGLTGPDGPAPLRMTAGARAAAAADRVSEDEIRAAIAEPEEVEPDPAGGGRMRLRRGTLRVVLARDGAVLSVRDRTSRRRS